jgi:hypothetical protein
MWIALSLIAAASLLAFWRGPNAAWAGTALGAIGGFLIAGLSAVRGNGFAWLIIGKAVVVGVLVGLIVEVVAKLSNRAKTTV